MPSSASILAAGNPSLLAAFPGWKAPTFLNLRATIGASGVATVIGTASANGDPGTTPGLGLARTAAGVYELTFPPCRSVAWSTLKVNTKTDSAAGGTFAVTDVRQVAIDRNTTNTNAGTGKGRLGFFTNAGLVPAELEDGIEVILSFWADLG